MAVKNEGFPDLERYLEERGRHLVTYTEGATMYHIPYYSDRGNWQPLCEHHHNVKTMTEDRYVEYRF